MSRTTTVNAVTTPKGRRTEPAANGARIGVVSERGRRVEAAAPAQGAYGDVAGDTERLEGLVEVGKLLAAAILRRKRRVGATPGARTMPGGAAGAGNQMRNE